MVVETDYHDRVPGYDSWWDVPIAEVSDSQAVQEARTAYVEAVKKERYFWPAPAEGEEGNRGPRSPPTEGGGEDPAASEQIGLPPN